MVSNGKFVTAGATTKADQVKALRCVRSTPAVWQADRATHETRLSSLAWN